MFAEFINSFQTYFKLLRFTKPYRTRLIIGVLAGFMSGGSLFGVLYNMPNLIRSFEVKKIEKIKKVKKDDSGLARIKRIAKRFDIQLEKADGSITWQFMLLGMIGLPVFIFLKTVFTYVNRYCMRWVGARVVVDLRNAIFANLQRQSLRFYGASDTGNLISRCFTDTGTVEDAISASIADLSRAPVEVFASLLFVIYFAIEKELLGLAAIMFVVVPFCFVPIIIFGKKIKKYTQNSLCRVSELSSCMLENLTGIRVVKAFNMEEKEIARFNLISQRFFRQILKALRAELLMTPMMELVGVLFICLFLVFCFASNIALSQILPMVGAGLFAYGPIKRLAKINNRIQQSIAASDRIFEMLELNDTLAKSPNPIKLTEFNDKIEFDHISFTYADSSPFKVDDVSLTIKKGDLVAFVGDTGSGKTTMANLLVRFYDPDSGSVKIDDIDLRDIDIASLRFKTGIVTQETVLFNDTIAYNISYGSEFAGPEEIEHAARLANAHNFIIAEPEGYQRVVGDKGFKLSGGERQRIAIARAIMRDPDILILDEATSALDTATEQLIQEALDRLMGNRTVFAIAHRLSTVRNAACIYVMEKGEIIESGTHEELLKGNGKYCKLHDIN